MMASGTILCAIPGSCWGTREHKHLPLELLRRFLHDLSILERRIQKNVARDDEVQRYSRLCTQIEQVALSNAVFSPTLLSFRSRLNQGYFPSIRIGSEYVDLLREMQLKYISGPNSTERFGASIFSPQQVKSHVSFFANTAKSLDYHNYSAIKHRVWFLTRRVTAAGCGLVEIPDPLSISLLGEETPSQGNVDGRDWWERLWEQLLYLLSEKPKPAISPAKRRAQHTANFVPSTSSTDWQQYGQIERRGDFMEDRLRGQIRAAITEAVPVNLMNQRQNMVIKILQEFIHTEPTQKSVEIPVMYNDGRVARSFPLFCLPHLPDGWQPTKQYHFALISMRHLNLDQYIDMNWYRNVEVPTRGGLAASDEYCYQLSTKQLNELLDANSGHRLRIHLYHTGYMPAVVGFYRAVVATLASGRYPPGCLQVVPKLQPGKKTFIEGNPWPE